jgi:hypothetical protein
MGGDDVISCRFADVVCVCVCASDEVVFNLL